MLVALVPPLFTLVANVLSLAQALRIGILLPAGLLLAAGAVGAVTLPRRWGVATLMSAGLLAAILQPARTEARILAAVAAVAIVAALVRSLVRSGAGEVTGPGRDLRAAALVGLSVLPALVVGIVPFVERVITPDPVRQLPEAIRVELAALSPSAVVLGDLESAYLVPVWSVARIYAAPPANVAATKRNAPYARAVTVRRILKPETASDVRERLLQRTHATAVLIDRSRWPQSERLIEAAGFAVAVESGDYVLLRRAVN